MHYEPVTASWSVTGGRMDSVNVRATATYGTKRRSFYDLLQSSLNMQPARVDDYVEEPDGKKRAVPNVKETRLAQDKQKQIEAAFRDWIFKDPDRRRRLAAYYNEHYNNLRPREYDGSFLTFPGMNPEITLRPHQRNAVARILFGGNTLVAHAVGAGKTIVMGAAAMEKKRLGLCNEVARLSTLRSAHNAQIYELQDLVSIGYPAAIRRIGQELDALRQDAALFQSSLRKDDKGNEMFSAVIQGVTYTKRADADAALLEACKAAAAGAGEKKIGRYCGFDICVGYDPKIIGFAGYLQGEQRYRIELNPKQNFSSFRAVLENISAQIPVKIAAREEIEKNIESAKEAAKQPFAYEEEFQTKLARLNELNILLDQEKQELVQNEKENRMQKENVNLHAEENEDWEASTVEPAAKLPAGWKWTMYSDGSGRLEGPDKQSLYSYDRMTYASAGEIEYRKSNNSSWDVFPEGSLDRFREWAEQQLLQELKKEPLQYQEFLEHQSHQDDEIEKNPLDMEDAARQAGLTVQRDQDKPGAAYFDADQNVIHVSDAGSEEDVRLSELKGYADAVIQRTATVEQPVRDLESASLAVMLAARYDVGVSDRLSQQLASAHAEAVKCPTFDLPVTLQRLDKALDYCDHFLAHEQERALEQEAENEPEPEQVTELSPQSQAFMMDL